MAKLRPADVIKQLEATTKRKEKEEILRKAYKAGCLEFFEGAKMAYDNLLVFNIKKVPEVQITDPDEDFTPTFNFSKFRGLAKKLRDRELTGNAAREAVDEAALESDPDDWNYWFRRILIKDLRCGITEKTVNTIIDEFSNSGKTAKVDKVQKHEVMAAETVQEGKEDELTGEWLADIKCDGMRLTSFLDVETGTVKMLTRSGHEKDNFPDIKAALARLTKKIPGSIVLEGEVMAGNNDFQTLSTQINRKDNVNTKGYYYAVFDILSMKDFETGKFVHTQEERHNVLIEMVPLIQQECGLEVRVLPKKRLNLNTKKGHEEMARMLKESLQNGGDGLMLKDPKGVYEKKRSKYWMKLKPYVDVTVKITGFYEGEGKNKGRLGGVIGEGNDLDPRSNTYKNIKTECGGGWSDELREDIWKNQKAYLGRLIEVRGLDFTQDKKRKANDDTWAIRHPRFRGFRDDPKHKGIKI